MKILPYVLISIVLIGTVLAEETHDFTIAKNIIDNKTPCSQLSENDLEQLGDYYMEQMHPGEAHERMDAMMGGEGSESLRNMHINMGSRFYCEGETMSTNNMMMGGGMMMGSTGMYQGGSSFFGIPYQGMFYGGFIWILLVGLTVFFIIWILKNNENKDPLRTLKNRYAKGEISTKEYQRIKKEL